jgi:hypothetical protein
MMGAARQQAMGNALMQPQPKEGDYNWIGSAEHPRDLSMYNNTGNSIPNLSAQQMGMTASPGMGLGNAQAPQLGGQFGIARNRI